MVHIYHYDGSDRYLSWTAETIQQWPDHFVHVASVQTDDLEVAFRDTNSIHRNWEHNEKVTVMKPNNRSTSVGDVAVAGNKKYVCCAFGWKEF